MTGTAAQFPFLMGQLEVQACVAARKGATLDPVTVAPQTLITADNVADAKKAAPHPWFSYASPFGMKAN